MRIWRLRRSFRLSVRCVALAAGAAACRPPRARVAAPASAFADQVIPLMRRYQVPRVGVAIVRGDRVVVDTILSLDGVARSDARFEAASLSKPVFAAVVLMLARAGRIDLDEPLANHPGWPRLDDPRAGSITARMILSHSSGLANAGDNPSQRLAFAPGEQWRYSGEGYRYLQRVVEQATGQPLDAVARRLVFAPLDMSRSTFVDSGPVEPTWLIGHDRSGRPMPAHRFAQASAATSLRTTLADYAHFVGMMLGGAPGQGAMLARQDIDAMLRPAVVVDSSLAISRGLGWAIADSVAFHWGSNPGFKNFVLIDRAQRLGVVMFTDADNGLEIAPALVAAVTGRSYPFFRFYMLHPND